MNRVTYKVHMQCMDFEKFTVHTIAVTLRNFQTIHSIYGPRENNILFMSTQIINPIKEFCRPYTLNVDSFGSVFSALCHDETELNQNT